LGLLRELLKPGNVDERPLNTGAEMDFSKNFSAVVSTSAFIYVYVSFFTGDDSIEADTIVEDGIERLKGLENFMRGGSSSFFSSFGSESAIVSDSPFSSPKLGNGRDGYNEAEVASAPANRFLEKRPAGKLAGASF
jgi:hypothetical protein